MRRTVVSIACALLVSLGPLSSARAQTDARLLEVREAYAAVDYDRTRALAKAAIESGGNARTATGELYFLWGLAAAALDRADESRVAFGYALAVDPELKAERSLSPKLRAPYQEARGELTGADGKPPLDVAVRRSGSQLELAVRDRAHLAAALELSTRPTPARAFSARRWPSSPLRRIPLPGGGVDYFVRLLDAHQNVLFELGTEDDPRRLPSAALGAAEAAPRAPGPDVNRTPYYVTAATLGALGLVAGGVSTAMYFRREAAARDWNGPGCEKPGSTRAEQCDAVDDRRRAAERLAIGFGATGGALLLGGVVTLLLTPPQPRTSAWVDTTPHSVVLGVHTTL